MAEEKLELGLNLDDYQYDARHYPAQGHGRWIDYNYVQGIDFSSRCPTWQNQDFDAYGIAGKCDIVDYLLRGKLDYASPTLKDVVFRDPMCGSCDIAGKRNLDFEFQLMLESLRVRLVEKGYGPMPQHVAVTDCILKSGNRFGRAQSERKSWLPRDIKPQAKADTLYFAGCRAAMTDTAISQATARIMAAANVPFRLLDNEPCCGHFVFITGQLAKAKKLAAENLKLIRKAGAKTVVFSCAECYKTFKVDYPKMLGFATSELGFEVKHITELADQWLKEGSLKLNHPLDIKVTYHDPCNLGRMSEPWLPWAGKRGQWGVFEPPRVLRRGVHGVYEPPRNLLRAIKGLTLAEMVRHHENAFCSGADGGVPEAFPDFARWTASERMREAASTGAEAVVTACPGCKAAFTGAESGLKIYDITELLVKATG
ncbi:MAG: (Fe-S)-binding protein [Chloroflexota bacterium]